MTDWESWSLRTAKRGAQLVTPLAEGIRATASIPERSMRDHPAQKLYSRMVNHPMYKYIWKQHLLLPTDKNMGDAIIHKDWMAKHTAKLLDDQDTYQVHPDNLQVVNMHVIEPWKKFVLDLAQDNPLLASYIDPLWVDETLPKMAHFYPLPKIHKTPIAARPIVGAPDCLTTKMSKLLTDILQKLDKALLSKLRENGDLHLYKVVTQTQQAISNLETIRRLNIPHRTYWHVFDFESMYTNLTPVFVQNMIEALCTKILRIPDSLGIKVKVTSRSIIDTDPFSRRSVMDIAPTLHLEVKVDELLDMIEAVMKFNWFFSKYAPGKLFNQLRGLAMGSNVSPIIANLALAVLEIFNQLGFNAITQWLDWEYPIYHNPNMQGYQPSWIIAARYIDDLIVGNTSPHNIIHEVQRDYALARLRLTDGTHTRSTVVYLDMEVDKISYDQLRYRLYSKPGTKHDYHHLGSYIPRSATSGLIIGGLKRINMLTHPNSMDNSNSTKNFIRKLITRGYSTKHIINVLNRHESSDNSQEPDYHIVISYHEGINRKWVNDFLASVQKDLTKRVVFRTHPNLLAQVQNMQDSYKPNYAAKHT